MSGPVWQPIPEEVAARFKEQAPHEPAGADAAYEEFLETILPYPMGTTHPRFWSWYMGNGTVLGALADFMAAITNSNLGGGNHAAILVEEQVINWLKDMIGFPRRCKRLIGQRRFDGKFCWTRRRQKRQSRLQRPRTGNAGGSAAIDCICLYGSALLQPKGS